MKDLVKIGIGFLVPVLLLGAGILYFPDSLRVHPALIKPMFVKKIRFPKAIESDVLLLGGCAAYQAPYKVHKIAVVKDTELDKLLNRIAESNLDPKTVVVMHGVYGIITEAPKEEIEKDIDAIVSAAQIRFPNSEIVVISPFEIAEIAKTHHREGGDIWHLNERGYELLKERHPDISAP